MFSNEGGSAEQCGLKSGDELVAVNGAPLSDHYLESVVAVVDQVIHQGPLEFSVRRCHAHAPPAQRHRLQSAEKTPPPLPDAPPPPLPAAQPPQFPVSEAFTVEGDDWTFIDDEFSRDLDNILEEEDVESGAETGYVSGDAGYNRPGVGYSSDDDVSSRAAVADEKKRNEFLGLRLDASDERRAVFEGNNIMRIR